LLFRQRIHNSHAHSPFYFLSRSSTFPRKFSKARKNRETGLGSAGFTLRYMERQTIERPFSAC
jgi:hypothetical protein